MPEHSYSFLQYLGYIILITTLTMQKRSSNVCLGLLLVARNSLKGSAHPCFFMGDGKRTTTIVANSSTICGSTWPGDLPKLTRTYTILRYTDIRLKFPRTFLLSRLLSLVLESKSIQVLFMRFPDDIFPQSFSNECFQSLFRVI